MKINNAPYSINETLTKLQEMSPETPEGKKLLESVTQYVSAILPRGGVNKKGQIHFSASQSEADACPICCTSFTPHDEEERKGTIFADWECDYCESSGIQYYKKVFDGQTVESLGDDGYYMLYPKWVRSSRENTIVSRLQRLRMEQKLLTKDFVLTYLSDNGRDDRALSAIRKMYQNKIGGDPTVHYPISTGIELGAGLVPVMEGLLCLPFDAVDKDNGEIYDLEKAYILDEYGYQRLRGDFTYYSDWITALLAAEEKNTTDKKNCL